LTDNSLQSEDKDQQEMRGVAEKLHDAVVKFDTYRNVLRHRAVLPAIARLLLAIAMILHRSHEISILCVISAFEWSLMYIRKPCCGRETARCHCKIQ